MTERQAGATEEIEITPEMVKVGEAILCGFETETVGEDYWAEEVFREMAKVSPNAKGWIRQSPCEGRQR